MFERIREERLGEKDLIFPGDWLHLSPLDFWFTFRLRNGHRQRRFVGFASRPICPSTHTLAPSHCPSSSLLPKKLQNQKPNDNNQKKNSLLGTNIGARWEKKNPRDLVAKSSPGCEKGENSPTRLKGKKTNPLKKRNNRNHNQTSSTKTGNLPKRHQIFFFFFVPINNLP